VRGPRWLPPWAILALGAFPLLAILLPAALGHPPILGDNATQNISLRWLAARDEAALHWPTWDPYNWDGAPLLAGFNAGALFPLIALFMVLPANWAMVLTLAVVWFLTELAVAGIARRLGLSVVPAVLAAVTFCDMGSFVGQVVHIDMLEGDLGSVLAIYFLLRLLEEVDLAGRVRAACGLSVGYGLAILAGAPEAMLAGLVALAAVALVRLARREVPLVTAALIVAAALVSLGLAAAQWIPGLAYAAISTRAHLPPNYAGLGPFAPIFFPLIALPYAYGGPAGGYLPSYFGNYNANEINVAIGSAALLLVVVALSVRRIPHLAPWARPTLIAIGAIGLALALGSYTPIAQVVYHLPLFKLQRLASRYLLDVDLSLTLLGAAGLEVLLERWLRGRALPRTARVAVVAVASVVVLAAVALVVVPRTILPHLRVVSIPSGAGLAEWRAYLLVQAALVAGAAVALVAGGTHGQWRRVVLVATMIVDLGLAATQFVDLPAFYEPHGNASLPSAAALVPAGGSYGIYDPNLYLYNRAIAANEQPDRNVFTGLHSIQGYASLSLASYNDLTGTKPESTLNPQLLGFYHRRLDLDVLVTSRRYLHRAVAGPSSAAPAQGLVRLLGGSARFFVGDVRGASLIVVPRDAAGASATLHFTDGSLVHLVLRPTGHFLEASVPPADTDLAWISLALSRPLSTRLPVFLRAGTQWLLVCGPLVNHALPRMWRAVPGQYSSVDLVARRPVTGLLHPPRGVRTPLVHQATDGALRAIVVATRPVEVPTTLAWAPGWRAHGARIVDEDGLIAIAVEPGRHEVRLAYQAPGLTLGLVLSSAALVVLALALGLATRLWLSTQRLSRS